MKIDIHTHTKKIKSGDSELRNIDEVKFREIISLTDVKILAITNHNHFDLIQYDTFRENVKDICQIWPGIELDVLENDKKSHLIVVVNPDNYIEFNERISNLLIDKNPDTFTISIKETVDAFDDLDCVYIAHYLVKKPNLGDKELDLLSELVANSKRILKEATNSISAGIYISHGHNSIFGSDVQNWDDYVKNSDDLPDLRLPVESFSQFCLLLEKDEATINTLLNKKVKETIEIAPFTAAELIRLDIYNDINILFGSKGTGKTEILDALSRYFNAKGHKTNVYKSNEQHLNDVYDLKGNEYNINVAELEIDDCEEEIKFIKEVSEEEVTSISKYLLHYSIQETNKISLKLKIKNIAKLDEAQPQRKLEDVYSILTKIKAFNTYIIENDKLNEFVENELIDDLTQVTAKIISKIESATESNFFEYESVKMLNNIIETFNIEIAKKTGQPQKPTKTGFASYARNRIKIEIGIKKILENINKKIIPVTEHVGSLGKKGDLVCQTNLLIHDGRIADGNYTTVKNVNKTPQKEFVKTIISISKHIYSNDLFEKITNLNEIEGIETIQNLSDLLLFYRHFTINQTVYHPSNGESSMILLYQELQKDKDIYLIDEPEKSLGNDYINDQIVPLLKDKALLGKKVIIATHDANIAVRTLPYNSIYRMHDMSQYFTLIGNPFLNKLKCINGIMPDLDWKETSMRTLEGGRNAFGERGKIYGN